MRITRTDEWLRRVITRRANIELMFIDPYWNRLQFAREYRFAVPVLNVTTIMRGSHPDRYASASDSPVCLCATQRDANHQF